MKRRHGEHDNTEWRESCVRVWKREGAMNSREGKERHTRREWVREMPDHPGVLCLTAVRQIGFWLVHCQLQVWSAPIPLWLIIYNLDPRVNMCTVSFWYGSSACISSIHHSYSQICSLVQQHVMKRCFTEVQEAGISSIWSYSTQHKGKEGPSSWFAVHIWLANGNLHFYFFFPPLLG